MPPQKHVNPDSSDKPSGRSPKKAKSISTLSTPSVPASNKASNASHIQFGRNPVNPIILPLLETTLADGIPLYKFVNLTTAKLFEQVQVSLLASTILINLNANDFRLISNVFWASFFINQRGCPSKLHNALLYQLISKNLFLSKTFKNEKSFYEEEFIKAHDSLLDEILEELDAFCDKWMNTNAAKAWHEIIRIKR